MRRTLSPRGSLVALAIFVVGLCAARAATGASRERRFFSARLGVGVETPNGWTLSQHTGYSEILCVLVHPDGSRISLSAAATKASDAKALAEQSRRGLEAQHLTITRVAPGPRGGVLLDARGAGRPTELRQLYIVRPAGAGKAQGVVLTLSTRTDLLPTAQPAFDWAIAHLTMEPPANDDVASADAGVPPAASKPDARLSP
jgi:hypothetical protein